MLNFAQYRNRPLLEEAEEVELDRETEKTASRLRAGMERTAKPAATAPAPAKITMPSPLIPDLEKTIDSFVSQLKTQLVMPSAPEARRGVWDRIKGWWSNLWYGRYNQDNPYYWQNKLGDDMGRTVESVLPIPLSHYTVLREQANLLELALPSGTEKLQIMRVIDNWARQFKSAVIGIVNKHNEPVTAPPSPDAPAPAAASTPTERPTAPAERPVAPAADEKLPGGAGADWPDEIKDTLKPKGDGKPKVDPAIAERQQKMLDDLERLKDRMPPTTYEMLKRHIESGQEDHMNIAQIVMDKKRLAPLDDSGRTGEAELPKEKLPDEEKKEIEDEAALPPKNDGRPWSKLSPHERTLWDQAGGGDAGDVSHHAKRQMGILTLPWILRIGDPRLELIEKIPGKSLYRRLIQQKRIEDPSHPIKTTIQLEKAVELAKTLASEESGRVSDDRKKRHERSRLKKNIRDRLEGKTADDGRTAPLPTEGEKEKEKPGGEKDKLKPPRTAPLGDPAEKPTRDVKELLADLESMKDEVDETAWNTLKKWLDSGDPARIARAEQNIKALKEKIEIPEGGGHKGFEDALTAESTLRDKTAFVLGRFRRLVNEQERHRPVSSRDSSLASVLSRFRIA